MAPLDYRALAVLDAVASHGSFEKAATALGISQSAVSQRIKALEDAASRPCRPGWASVWSHTTAASN
jgi:LysR family transcriptional regulator (chromosome initiation inhibitor)